jgi:hypothetical protein
VFGLVWFGLVWFVLLPWGCLLAQSKVRLKSVLPFFYPKASSYPQEKVIFRYSLITLSAVSTPDVTSGKGSNHLLS